MPNYDPNSQDSWVQPVDPNQEPGALQQGGQTRREQWTSQQENAYPTGPSMGQGGGLGAGVTNTVRQDVQEQINGLIDHDASQVPGGHMFAPEAKQALAGVLDNLQQKLENQAQSRLSEMGGGLGSRVAGGLFGNEPGNEGGQRGQ